MSEMGRLEFSTPREAWGGEAVAFTPLLAAPEMLEYLGAETGIGPLHLVETEHATAGGRSLDILAETADGSSVAIENQYGVGDHDHLTRGLAYAVAAGCSILVVIAEEHRDEFVSVADYLNEAAENVDETPIRVWLVKVRATRRVGDTVWSPEFVVRAQPNEWEADVRKDLEPKLRDLDDFVERTDDAEYASWARSLIDWWCEFPGASEGHDAKSTVALYLETASRPGKGTNVFQLRTNGIGYLCRDYLWQTAGLFDPDAEPVDLDDAIREHVPDAIWSERQAYIRVEGVNEGVRGFLAWLADYRDRLDGKPAASALTTLVGGSRPPLRP